MINVYRRCNQGDLAKQHNLSCYIVMCKRAGLFMQVTTQKEQEDIYKVVFSATRNTQTASVVRRLACVFVY